MCVSVCDRTSHSPSSVDRVLSEFYFVREHCGHSLWWQNYPSLLYKAICRGDLWTFIQVRDCPRKEQNSLTRYKLLITHPPGRSRQRHRTSLIVRCGRSQDVEVTVISALPRRSSPPCPSSSSWKSSPKTSMYSHSCSLSLSLWWANAFMECVCVAAWLTRLYVTGKSILRPIDRFYKHATKIS
jgi:hypothetical protein